MDKENNYCYDDYIYALFIEDKLNGNELQSFIEHLRVCKKCLYIVSNLHKDLKSYESTQLLTFPDYLYQKTKSLYSNIKKVYFASIKKIKDKIEVLKHSYPEQTFMPALRFKGNKDSNILKFNCENFNIELYTFNDFFNIVINFNETIERKIMLLDNSLNILQSYHINSDKAYIEDLKKGEYTIAFENTELNFILKS